MAPAVNPSGNNAPAINTSNHAIKLSPTRRNNRK